MFQYQNMRTNALNASYSAMLCPDQAIRVDEKVDDADEN